MLQGFQKFLPYLQGFSKVATLFIGFIGFYSGAEPALLGLFYRVLGFL